MLILFNYRSFDFLCRRNDLLYRRKDLLSCRNGLLCLCCRSDELTSSPKGKERSPESQHGIIKTNSDMNQGMLPCCKFAKKTTIYNTNKNLVNDDVYTKFGLVLSICSQDIE